MGDDFHSLVREWFNAQTWFSTILPFVEVNDVRGYEDTVQISGTVAMPGGAIGAQQHVVHGWTLDELAIEVSS